MQNICQLLLIQKEADFVNLYDYWPVLSISFEEKSFEEALECFDNLETVEFNEELVERSTKSKKEDEDGVEVEVDC